MRAELGSGDRDAAMALLERLKTRSVDINLRVVRIVLMAVLEVIRKLCTTGLAGS